ncbi:GlsB/YeaQ/YmgE family stress response membrane protein [Cetobacterium somerae]|uniref:GlsB/YeaQ/YmgE family stress response membrane protein n=1 Tax=Cetobacterium sp. NK01 TaxID=2993530 RepID=UPI002116F461|nr:GlsB/YeaQ/YmgE family stress response membrane protein [Cetobacterium sp. NK01]MCQ8212063.1 GlsB/YeaQ/YmgE family stress response membrane protein [Cetobacterium sp. NK01]
MGILTWIILGILAGALAKFIMPGTQGGGIIATMILGIVGAFVGGFIGSIIGIGSVHGLNIGSIFTAAFGAIVVLWLFNKFR